MLFITACGGGSQEQQSEKKKVTQANKTDQTSEVRTINIIGINQMKFVVKGDSQPGITTGETIGNNSFVQLKAISVNPGEKIQVYLTTKSKLPASAMSHNFIVLKRSADPETFDNAATQAGDNDYIPSDKSNQILAHTDLASGGETVEVTFTAPHETGENEFLCSFPGHFASGMKGAKSGMIFIGLAALNLVLSIEAMQAGR